MLFNIAISEARPHLSKKFKAIFMHAHLACTMPY